ncbi:MAG: hypothetical protein KKB34_19515 [Bacteroidetes bacterium]|nr:hypothetical protein [Bacteroidota bacterium]
MLPNKIKLVILSNLKEKENTKNLITGIISKYKLTQDSVNLKFGSPDRAPNSLLVSLEIPSNNALEIIKRFTQENLQILSNEPFIKNAIREGRNEVKINKIEVVHEIKYHSFLESKSEDKSLSIEKIAEMGDWQLLIKIAKNQSISHIDTSRKVKEILPEVLSNFIKNEIEKETDSVLLLNKKVDKLLSIAESADLNLLRMKEYMMLAGQEVLNISEKYPKEFSPELLKLANSSTAIPIVKLKAFILLYKIVSSDTELYKNEINNAARFINARALNTLALSVFNLTDEEKKLFEDGIDFFTKGRMNI